MINQIKTENLLDLSHTLAKPLLETAEHPFEILPQIGAFIKSLLNTLSMDEYDCAGDGIVISKLAKIAPTASITGPCIIGHHTEVRPGAFIRGNVLVGENAVVGNSTELKNVILFDNVQVPHYNYVGDSILGTKAHMGAGAITSNVKSDKTLVTVSVGTQNIATGLKKFGAVLGDNVEVGCNSVLNPGTVIGRNTSIYPLSMVRGFVSANSIYKNTGEMVDKRETRE